MPTIIHIRLVPLQTQAVATQCLDNIKPDICSPGIDIFGPMASVITDRTQKGDVSLARYGYMSGSSALRQ